MNMKTLRFKFLIFLWMTFLLAPFSKAYLFREYANPSYHTHYTITREALAHAVVTYITDESALPTNKTAVETLDEMFSEDKEGRELYQSALDEIIVSMSERYRNIYSHPTQLMTDELIQEGNSFLMKTRQSIIELSSKKEPDTKLIRQLIGRFLLTQQMFYCNTNWLELTDNKPCLTLGVNDKFEVPIAGIDDPTCRNCYDQIKGDCLNNLIGKKLTSGYLDFYNSGVIKPLKPEWREKGIGKCSHGGSLDNSSDIPARGGINKETTEYLLSPHFNIHDQSGKVSVQAATYFFVDEEHGIFHKIGNHSLQTLLNVHFTKSTTTVRQSTTKSVPTDVPHMGSTTNTPIKSSTNPDARVPTVTVKPITAEPYCYNCYQSSLSLVFVIDDTGSMGDDIRQVRTQATDIVSKAQTSTPLASYILVTFNDPASATTYYKTTNATEIIPKLNQIRVNGGGDCPEYAFTGLLKGIENAEKGSCVFLFTDADPKDINLCEKVSELVMEKDIHLVTFLTGKCDGPLEKGNTTSCIRTKQTPFDCSARRRRSLGFSGWGGAVIPIPDRKISEALTEIFEKNLDIKYINIAVIKNFRSGNKTFPVDSKIDVLIIEIQNEIYKSNVKILRPNNTTHLFTESDTMECVGGRINKCVASIKHPMVGFWTIINSYGRTWLVDIKGQGSVDVKVKLMERKYGSLLDIVGQPISGSNVTIVAAIDGLNKSAVIDCIKLYDDNYNELTKAPVALYHESGIPIVLSEVIVPQKSFIVVVEGHADVNTFQRKIPQTITPSVADLQIAQNDGIILRGKSKNLTCFITNYGLRNTTFIVQVTAGKRKTTRTRRIQVASGNSTEATFLIQEDSSSETSTINFEVKLDSGEIIQNRDISLMVVDTPPPVITGTITSLLCLPENLNFENCSNQALEANLTIHASTELNAAYTKPETSGVSLQKASNKTYLLRVQSDCCVPKFRVFLNDKNNNLIQKVFDFVASNSFSHILPQIKEELRPVYKKEVLSKVVVYSSISVGVLFLIVIIGVLSNAICRREQERKHGN